MSKELIVVRDVSAGVMNKLVSDLKHPELELVSMTLIGPEPDLYRFCSANNILSEKLNRDYEFVNDFDVVVITKDPMTKEKYMGFERVLENLRNYSKENLGIDVIYAIADGPMKPQTENPYEVFIHFILHTTETYRNIPLQLCANSWQQQVPIFGIAPVKLKPIDGVTLERLLNDPLGINNLIKLVENNESAYLGWKEGTNQDNIMEMSLVPLQFEKNEDKLELYYYAVLRGASNALRYFTGDNSIGIGKDMIYNFKERFSGFIMANLPEEMYNDKRLLRNRRLLTEDSYTAIRQAEAMGLLENLRDYILKNNFLQKVV